MTPEQQFHDHLKSCEQCEKNPFNLCPAGHALLLATGNEPIESTEEKITPEELRARFNRQVAQLRTDDPHKVDCVCEQCTTDWHDGARWPVLLWELPRNTHLYIAAETPPGEPRVFKVCGCFAEGMIRACQDGPDPGTAVVRAWIAWKLGSKIIGSMPDIQFTVPGSNTVH